MFDFTLTDEDMAVFATLDDPAFKPIFDHLDVDTVSGLLNVFVGKQLNENMRKVLLSSLRSVLVHDLTLAWGAVTCVWGILML